MPGARSPAPNAAKRAEQAARDKRLGEALRANLRRRKEQARARRGAAGDRSGTDTPKDDRGGD